MPVVQCPVPGCDYVTEDLDPNIVAALLNAHSIIHTPGYAAKDKQVGRSTIAAAGSSEEGTRDRVTPLLECCDEPPRKDLTRSAGGIPTNKTESEVLASIKNLAVRKDNAEVASLQRAWNVLVLGDETIVDRFNKYAKPRLAKFDKNKHIVVYSDVEDQPFDAVLLALDLESLRIPDNPMTDILGAEEIAVNHFGETIQRHIIILLGYDKRFYVSEDIPKYIEQYAPDRLKELLEKYERRWIAMCLDDQEDDGHIKMLKRRIDEVSAENCGPIKHRIILLGGRDSKKYNIGNLILNEDVFGDTEPAECVAEERVVAGKRVLVVNTPAVQPESVDDVKSVPLNQMKISESLLLTSPGPRVFVMVISETERNDDISACFKVFENRFGMEAYSHLIVVLKRNRQQLNIPDALHSRSGKLEGKLIFDHGGSDATAGNYIQKKILFMIKKTDVESKKKELSLVLLGPSRVGKSHTANNLLGTSADVFSTIPQQSASRVSVAMRSVGDHEVVIADTPSLGTHLMSNEEVFREIEKCVFFPDKRPRPIVVVLRCDRPLKEPELKCLQFIEKRLPDRTSIVLFTRKKHMELRENFRDFLKQAGSNAGPLRTLLSACHWRCVAYENTEEQGLREQNNVVFALVKQVMNPNTILQLVLVGHTGSGKSASGNTIMSTPGVFDTSFSQISNTEECQVQEFEVAGRQVRLVDTPGLFDTRPQNDNTTTMMELCKCVLYTLPGPHVFLFVIDASERFTGEAQQSMKLLKQIFGDEMLRHMVVIFTRLDALKKGNRTVESIIDEIRQGGSEIGKEFFSRSGEYVAFNNRDPTGDEGRELVEAAERVTAANEHHHFTNRTYEDIVERLKWYGTGGLLNVRYQFEKHPDQFSSAVGFVAGLLPPDVVALPIVGFAVAFAAAALKKINMP